MNSMKVIITGGTGFIGKKLTVNLTEKGYKVIILTRHLSGKKNQPDSLVEYCLWDGKSSEGWLEKCEGKYAIINLAGENIGKGRWTDGRKKSILESRLRAAAAVCEAVKKSDIKPSVVIQGSAIGYYDGNSGILYDETSLPGNRFLSETVKKWEESALSVKNENVRLVIARTGVVLGSDGGFLPRIILPFRLFAGGPIGSGLQWISWIHIEDEINALIYLLENQHLEGIFNLCVPEPLQSGDLLKKLAAVLHRPYWFPTPGFIIRLVFGEMGKELVLSGERTSGKKIACKGFKFKFEDIGSALESLIGKRIEKT